MTDPLAAAAIRAAAAHYRIRSWRINDGSRRSGRRTSLAAGVAAAAIRLLEGSTWEGVAASHFPTRDRRTLAGAATWLLLPIVVLQIFPLDPVIRLQRAYVEEVYFEQAGAMAREFPATALPPGIFRRKDTEVQLPPSSWPFTVRSEGSAD